MCSKKASSVTLNSDVGTYSSSCDASISVGGYRRECTVCGVEHDCVGSGGGLSHVAASEEVVGTGERFGRGERY